MSDTPLVFGADGGGTKTLGLIATREGRILAQRQVGASNPNVVGVEVAGHHIFDLISQCCRDAHCTLDDIHAVVLGLAGAGSALVHDNLREAINALVAKSGAKPLRIGVEGDTRIALEGAFAGGPGIVVIAGTGSMLIGKTPAGMIHSVGGWGRVLGDEGSGYHVALEALKAVTRSYDNRGDSGILRQVFAEKYGWDSRDRIIAAVYREKFDIPSLAPLVLEGAGNNDPVCRSILRQAAGLLGDQVSALVGTMDVPGPVGLVLCGGLVDHPTAYSTILGDEILKRCPSIEVRSAMHSPAHGAVLLALEQLRKQSTS